MTEKLLIDKVTSILALSYHGLHHVYWKIHEWNWGIEVNVPDGLATFDSDTLTRLVIGAHNECVRLEICASAPRKLKLRFHNRTGQNGRIYERHPTITEAIEIINVERTNRI